jgi:MoCo/4Fe-4S cofactor protein with predicted Tat translocation signal
MPERDPRVYWQSLEDLAGDAPAAAGEFPGGRRLRDLLGEGPSGSRRDFLKAMGFGLAAASAAACSPIPERRAVPMLAEPEGMLPGVASWYATTCGGCPAGCGLLVKVRDGRPIKVEGNPDSALSRGGTCAVGQATVLSLYDEGRLRGPLWRGRPASWAEVDAAIGPRLAAAARRSAPAVLLTGTLHGPAHRALIAEWLRRLPGARHVVHDPAPAAALRRACGEVFGVEAVPHFRLDRARVVVGLEADFLGTWLSPVEFARDWARLRRPGPEGVSWHVQVESGLSLTGSNADLRLPVAPSQLGAVALALLAGVARRVGEPVSELPPELASRLLADLAADLPWDLAQLDHMAAALWHHRGAALVLCGSEDLAVQRVVARLNALLAAAAGEAPVLDLGRPSLQRAGDPAAVSSLVAEMERGEIGALLLWGVNPVYDHPEGERFRRALGRVALTVSFADRLDETAAVADGVCPDHHFLEAWGDAEPVAGRLHLRQPAIAPLFDTRAAPESLLAWTGGGGSWRDFMKEVWRREVYAEVSAGGFDAFWDAALERGGVDLPSSTPSQVRRGGDLTDAVRSILAAWERGRAARGRGEVEVHVYETVALRDGRWANNPWLQELPDPVTKLTWGAAAALPPDLAARLGLADGDVASLHREGQALELPALAQPGQAAGTVSLALGYGRRGAGRVGDGIGTNAFPLRRDAEAPGAGFRLERTGRSETLARTQLHASLEGRPVVRETTVAALAAAPAGGVPGNEGEAPSLWPEPARPGPVWGMAVDLTACTGCSACVVACQAENNVPVVGAAEVARGREMHWLRIDRYHRGPAASPATVHQPMLCQHCDNAPCETVCPVLATVHSADGLNQQVYNRCVGTRYCANNCPYKVRRFNWFDYAGNERFPFHMASELGRMVLNPDVVVRSRGVMEKCSLCIQRIEEGRLAARREGRPIADGDVRTACQQACPAGAIAFGDATDPASAVARQRRAPRFFRVLEELNTRPGVGYLARVRGEAAGDSGPGAAT